MVLTILSYQFEEDSDRMCCRKGLESCRVRVEKMSYFRLAGNIAVNPLLQLTIRVCLPLVLTEVFCPGVDQENFHKPIGRLDIAIDPPFVRAVTTPDASVLTHRLQELRLHLGSH